MCYSYLKNFVPFVTPVSTLFYFYFLWQSPRLEFHGTGTWYWYLDKKYKFKSNQTVDFILNKFCNLGVVAHTCNTSLVGSGKRVKADLCYIVISRLEWTAFSEILSQKKGKEILCFKSWQLHVTLLKQSFQKKRINAVSAASRRKVMFAPLVQSGSLITICCNGRPRKQWIHLGRFL
jgi:hypothetical protein